jgi:hypothetical protein
MLKIKNKKIRLSALLMAGLLVASSFLLWSHPKAQAIAVDSSTPAMKFVSTASTAWSSNSFSPPANSLLVAVIGAASGGVTTPSVTSMSDSLGSHLTWTKYNNINTFTDTETEIWWAYTASAQTGMTATVNWNVSSDGAVGVIVFTGAKSSQSGAATGTNSSGAGTPSKAITTTANNSLVMGAVSNWNSGTVTPTIPAGQGDVFNGNTYFVNNTIHDSGFWAQRQNSTTAASGTSVTINDTAPTGIEYSMVEVEILAAPFPRNATALDNFNRTSCNLNTGGACATASGGGTWDTGMNVDTCSLSIVSNTQATGSAALGNFCGNALSTVFGPDSEVYATVATVGNASPNEILALFARISNSQTTSFTAYELEVDQNGTWKFIRCNSSSVQVLLSNPSTTQALSAGDAVGMTVIGTASPTLTAYYKSAAGSWTQLGSPVIDNFTTTPPASNTPFQGSGQLGLEVAGNAPRIDDFSGGSLSNSTPAAPTLASPANAATGISVLPTFTLRTTDADSDYLRYEIQVCSTSNCSSVVRTICQDANLPNSCSASQTGWSGQDQSSSTAYTGSSTITSSTLATHVYQATALSPGTQYWWRAYAIDPGGSNNSSSVSSIFSFTTSSSTGNVLIQGGSFINGGTVVQ